MIEGGVVTRFLPLLDDRAVAPTTHPWRAVGRTLRCAGRQAACRTASNIDRVASRLGFVRPIDTCTTATNVCPERYGTYLPSTPHLSSATPTSIPHLSKLFPGAVTSSSLKMSPPSRMKALCDHDNAPPCLALQSSRGRSRAHFQVTPAERRLAARS